MMFLNDYVQRRLSSLLRPWLRQDPDLELQLGLLRSHGVAKNLRFDPSVFNRHLFDASSSSRWSFRDLTIEQLSVRVSYWSYPGLVLEVRGVRVALSLGELKEERGFRTRRRALDEMDPEGRDLHELLQTFASIISGILNYSQLKMHDIHVQVQFPPSNDILGCFGEIKELNAESMYTENGCILKGLISSLFSPSKEGSFSLVLKGFEIGLERRDRSSRPIISASLSTHIKCKSLRLMGVDLSVPVLHLSVSPEDLSIISAFSPALLNESNYPRSGRHLWKIASSRISSLMFTSRLTLYKLVGIICFWLRYVNAYENLLMLVGYPMGNIMEGSAGKIFLNDYVQRRLSSLLRPWLRQDPDLELELGLLRSHGVAKNLRFDPLVLNRAASCSTPPPLDGPSGT